MFTVPERATLLAALRHWQATLRQQGVEVALVHPVFREIAPLTPDEIDGLCDWLAELDQPCGCQSPGPFNCAVAGVLARVTDGRIDPASVERCDECQRFPSDAAAQAHLARLGRL
ncbi:MAG TPA: hypothetical protein VM165_21545 [Planctomycetaceae bacterium]|nr:hypothetical protein [Planctomycetaceae bacterium]